MKKISLLVIITVFFSACGPAPKESGMISTCRTTVDAMSALAGGLEIPDNFQSETPVKTGGEFDVTQYFMVLDHLSMQPGYILDYVYHYDGMGGFPILYVRPAGQSPYTNEAALSAGGNTTEYLDYVQTDDTPESYFQYVLLATMGNQFYLYWHANYSDSQVVCSKVDVSDIVATLNGDFGYRISLPSRLRAALLTNLAPTVKINEQTVEVRIVTFTQWGGFYAETYTISRAMPHTIQDVLQKNLVPYECGVLF